MKVLYLWNTAGVFSPVANWLNENGHEAKILARWAFDIYEQTSSLDCAVMVNSARDFYKASIKLIRSFKPDIIHVSGSLKALAIARTFAWRTPIVMTFHGADVRNPDKKPSVVATRLADFIHVTTQDLAPYGTWIDRPLDPMFHYRGDRQAGTALMFYKSHFMTDQRELARMWCAGKEIELDILDELHPDFPIPNKDMPALFSKYEYYLDMKGHVGDLYALSKTAREALACGCKVLHEANLEVVLRDYVAVEPETYLDLYETFKRASLWKMLKRLPRVAYYVMRFRSLGKSTL